ncbi:hypothetical protein HPB49_012043 [Dermacentor silvarum]|uniref:Uncharacterized protein n=1 Tax=Dermacentor silvarum TaxID=543639 RepID=A0ACB8E079_DERSI|nr:hypothetical protein HPB49_012043 [Dermacentor silvarum]
MPEKGVPLQPARLGRPGSRVHWTAMETQTAFVIRLTEGAFCSRLDFAARICSLFVPAAVKAARAAGVRLVRNIVESKPAPPPPPRRRRRRRRQRRKRLIRFLLPCLYDRRYGQDLEWIDEEGGTFRIRWSQHPGISQDPPVKLFKDWAVIKNMWNEDDPRNLDKAKNRVQSTLGRMEYVKKVESNDANYWCFRIENQQLLDDTKRRLRLKQQMKDGISHNVKYCPIHKTDYAPCCCECSSLRTPPVAVFPDQEEGDVTHFRDEFELFSTQDCQELLWDLYILLWDL